MPTRSTTRAAPGAFGVLAATKLRVPQARPELVPRDALVALVAGAPHTRVTLLSAPPGSGKTTLLLLWHRAPSEHRPFAWLSVDRADDDPVRFWACVIEALATVAPGTGERAAGTLRSPRADLEGVVVPLLVNDIAAWSEPAVLVLDDLQEVSDPRIHRSLSAFVDLMPPALHLAIATRVDPDLPLARLRARDELVELHGGHLRFTDDEAGAFLNGGLGLGLAAADVAALCRRTEGWAAGLQLAGLSLRGRIVPGEVADARLSGDRLVVDYLVAEVLDRVPGHLRAFLRRTSILDRLCGELCDAVTGESGSADLLRELERRNIFTMAVDAEGRWYRYHRLLADVLQRRLETTEPGLARELHRRASAWWAQTGDPPEAIAHAVRGGDVGAAEELVAANWSTYLNRGWLSTVAQWLRALPDDRLLEAPQLWLARAWTWLDVGALDELEDWLAAARGADDERAAWAAVLGALHRFKAGDVGAARAQALSALVDPPPTAFGGTVAHLVLGVATFWSADAQADRGAAFRRAHRLALEDDNLLAAGYALGHLALDAVERGALEEARAHLRDTDALAHASPPVAEHFTGLAAALARARLAQRTGDLDAAVAAAARAVELARRGGGLPELAATLLAHGEALQARGDTAAAIAVLAAARDVLARCPDPGRLRERRASARGPAPDVARDELSEGELRVLRLLPSELSLREIGGELYVSLNTVKTHTRNIYAKLGVGAREDAVARARELGVL